MKRTHRYPAIIVAISILISILMIIPISKLKWELQLIDTLSDSSETKKTAKALEKEFGGLGTLTIVLQSPDSLKNDNFVHRLVSEIQKNPLISHIDFESDVAFYKENQFLYIRYNDLEDIHTRIKKFKNDKILQENPLWVNLLETDSSAHKALSDEISFSDIENKYLEKLKNLYQNKDGTIRVIDIYPKNKISSLTSSREVFSAIKKIVNQENKDSIQVMYTGKVYHVINTGKKLLPESKKMGLITAFFIAILLLLHFYKQPQLILPAAIPIALSILWTLGFAYILYGRINLFTLLLSLIIPGHACQQIIHLLKRYSEERRQGLSPTLSLESSILGIGPATAASSFITGATLLSLALMPLKGLQELGILGAIGVILNWFLANTLLPSILILLQRKKPFELFEPKETFVINRTLSLHHPHPRFLILFIFIVTLFFAHFGIIPKFEYDFGNTENLSQENYVDSLLNETNYANYEPAIVLFDNPSMSEVFYDSYLDRYNKNQIQTISSVATFANLLPSQQEKKIEKLQTIRSELSPELLKYFKGTDSVNVQKIINSWNISELNENDLPSNILQKFMSKDGSLGKFAFIFPKKNVNDGLFCRRFTKEIKSILSPDAQPYAVTGSAIIHADILNLTIPYIHQSIIASCIAILLLTLLLYNKLSYSLFVLTAPMVSFIWILSCISFLEIKLSAYSILAFPLLIALSVDGSMQLWNVYFERSKTTAQLILTRLGPSIFLSQLSTLIGTYGLLLSSHNGIRSIGKISIIGLFFIILSHFIFFPLLAASLDFYRQKKKMLTHNKKL